MARPRFLLSKTALGNLSEKLSESSQSGKQKPLIELSDELYHRASRVLRLESGEEVELIEKESALSFLAEVVETSQSRLVLRILDKQELFAQEKIFLIAGLTKAKPSELVVQKCVEIGVAGFYFFQADKGKYRIKVEDIEKRRSRLARVAEAAISQSGACPIPEIKIFGDISEALRALHEEQDKKPSKQLRLLFEQWFPESEHLRKYLQKNSWLETNAPEGESYILIGPESGFSEREIQRARECGYHAVSLGERTLRAETAAIVSCGLLRFLRAQV